MAIEKIDKIKKISGRMLTPEVSGDANKDYFQSLMQQRKVSVDKVNLDPAGMAKNTESTLFDQVKELNQRVDAATKSSPTELASQAENVVAQIDTLKNKLETPNLEIKGSVQTILRNKLNHIDENLKIALDKAGVEYSPPEKVNSLQKPIDRFLGMLTHSQNQLDSLAQDVKNMSDTKMTPANMLMIQLKVSYVSQEIELFTSMLNKALESTKTLMNVQV